MKTVKLIWAASLLSALALIFVSYASMPQRVLIAPADLLDTAIIISREAYFYLITGTVLFFNITLNIFGRAVRALPRQLLLVPQKQSWFSNKETRQALYMNLKEWIRGISFIFNLFFCAVIGILLTNNSSYDFGTGWVIYFSGILAVGWLVFYPILFNKSLKELQGA